MATHLQMEPQRHPEIEEADLSPLLLSTAAFGETDVKELPWLTPPPAAHVAQATSLLQMLGAVGTDGTITRLGKRMAQLPCHPRMARMMLQADTPRLKALACDIAALLEEKDPMGDSPGYGPFAPHLPSPPICGRNATWDDGAESPKLQLNTAAWRMLRRTMPTLCPTTRECS